MKSVDFVRAVLGNLKKFPINQAIILSMSGR